MRRHERPMLLCYQNNAPPRKNNFVGGAISFSQWGFFFHLPEDFYSVIVPSTVSRMISLRAFERTVTVLAKCPGNLLAPL